MQPLGAQPNCPVVLGTTIPIKGSTCEFVAPLSPGVSRYHVSSIERHSKTGHRCEREDAPEPPRWLHREEKLAVGWRGRPVFDQPAEQLQNGAAIDCRYRIAGQQVAEAWVDEVYMERVHQPSEGHSARIVERTTSRLTCVKEVESVLADKPRLRYFVPSEMEFGIPY